MANCRILVVNTVEFCKQSRKSCLLIFLNLEHLTHVHLEGFYFLNFLSFSFIYFQTEKAVHGGVSLCAVWEFWAPHIPMAHFCIGAPLLPQITNGALIKSVPLLCLGMGQTLVKHSNGTLLYRCVIATPSYQWRTYTKVHHCYV